MERISTRISWSDLESDAELSSSDDEPEGDEETEGRSVEERREKLEQRRRPKLPIDGKDYELIMTALMMGPRQLLCSSPSRKLVRQRNRRKCGSQPWARRARGRSGASTTTRTTTSLTILLLNCATSTRGSRRRRADARERQGLPGAAGDCDLRGMNLDSCCIDTGRCSTPCTTRTMLLLGYQCGSMMGKDVYKSCWRRLGYRLEACQADLCLLVSLDERTAQR